MNKYGKGGTIFIVLIPVILILTLVVVDTIINFTTTKTYQKVTENILTEIMNSEIYVEDYSEEIKRAYERKGYETDMLVVEANSYDVYVENEHEYFNLFSSLSNKHGDEGEIKILGVTFKVKKNSVARLKVTATHNYEDELIFEYTK